MGNKNLFSEKEKHTQSEHLFRVCTACPDTKIKILNHGPRVSNGLDTDHD